MSHPAGPPTPGAGKTLELLVVSHLCQTPPHDQHGQGHPSNLKNAKEVGENQISDHMDPKKMLPLCFLSRWETL